MGNLGDEFRAGQESAGFRSRGDAVLRAVFVGIAVVIAVYSPVSLWVKVLIFLGVMFLIGVVVQVVKRR